MFTKATALAGLAAVAAASNFCDGPYFSFYNRGGSSVTYQSLDPAVNPGVKATHLHSFDGGNVLHSNMGYAETQEASCATNRIAQDKSAYWRPTLFWNGNSTGFYRVPDKFVKIYYKFGANGMKKTPVSEFPEDFMMFAGYPNARSEEAATEVETGLRWTCMHEDGTRKESRGFPTGVSSCKGGFFSEINFPVCWNGQPINPDKPHDHMAYANIYGDGVDGCPAGFQEARFPTIFMEFWYDITQFDGHWSSDAVPWVLSNGDPTGYGFHADFLNGWEKGSLAKVTADEGYCNCGCACDNEMLKKCFGEENIYDDNDSRFETCSAEPEFPGDDGDWMEELPGCNPIQSGPDNAVKQSGANCGGGSAPKPAPSAYEAPVAAVSSIADKIVEAASSAVAPIVTPIAAAVESAVPALDAIPVIGANFAENAAPAAGDNSPAQGVCGAVTTVITQEVVMVTLAPGEPIPTPAPSACQPATVFTTVEEVVTVTVQPQANEHYKRHLAQHQHHKHHAH